MSEIAHRTMLAASPVIPPAGRRSGLTLIEAVIACALLGFGLSSFIVAFTAARRVACSADVRLHAMHEAREKIDLLMAPDAPSAMLIEGEHVDGAMAYRIGLNAEFADVLDLALTVSWDDPAAHRQESMTFYTSIAKCLKPRD